MAVTSPGAVLAYGHRTNRMGASDDHQHELTETELDQVAGGKPSATPKQEAFPTETIKFSYGAMQWEYTS
jgi:hypothetical protein